MLLCVFGSALFGEEPGCRQLFINGTIGTCTPTASATVKGIYTIVRGDFLFWIARQDGLEYDLLSNTLLPVQIMQGVSVREVDFQWSPGSRISVGVRNLPDDWELKAFWTRFFTSASQKTEVAAGNGLLNNGVWNDGVGIIESADMTQMSAKWHLHYNLIDGGLSRSYFLGKNLSTDLSFGAAGVWIHQGLDVNEQNATAASTQYTIIPSEVTLRPELESSYSAGGLFLRASPQWNLSSSWSVLGTIASYIVHGVFEIDQKWLVPELADGDLKMRKSSQRTRIGLQSALGLQWQTSPTRANLRVAIAAQYEGIIWFKQNLFSQVNTTFAQNYERRSDLEMQGLSLSIRLDF